MSMFSAAADDEMHDAILAVRTRNAYLEERNRALTEAIRAIAKEASSPGDCQQALAGISGICRSVALVNNIKID